MDIVYTNYFQKSKVFLYPLLGIKKGAEFIPAETYICWNDLFGVNDKKYILIYNEERTTAYLTFELNQIKRNPFYYDSYHIEDKNIYIFDMSNKLHDFEMFLHGFYSKFSVEAKNKILNYFGNVGRISDYIRSFLSPEKYHQDYAKALNVELKLIEEVYELCTPPNIEKETLMEKIPVELSMLENK